MARTASRSVLGFMNDMASMSERLAAQADGIAGLDGSVAAIFLLSLLGGPDENRQPGRRVTQPP